MYIVFTTQERARVRRNKRLMSPGTTLHPQTIRRFAGRLGLDFFVAGVKFFNHQLGEYADSDCENIYFTRDYQKVSFSDIVSFFFASFCT